MSERKLASIQIIKDIKPINGADNIECATVLGWECVILKNEFKIGDKCVYFEIDSIVPEREEFEFLRDRKFRIKTIKLKKQISQGLALPLTILPNGNYNEGDDVTDIIGVKKYDPQAESEKKLIQDKNNSKFQKFLLKYKWYRKLFLKPKKDIFPRFIHKTDEERLQNIPSILEKEKDTEFSLTEKIDGSSGTYFLIKNRKNLFFKQTYKFGVCSRNVYLKKEDNSFYWTIAKQCKIKDVLQELIGNNEFVVLQGEIIGEGIQSNKYKIKGYDFYAFNLIYPNKQIETVDMAELLRDYLIKTVPILENNFKLLPTVNEMVDYAKGKSRLLDILREGLVIRNYEKGISFKVINPEFLLKNKE